MLLTIFLPNKRGLPNKLAEQTAFNTRPETEEHMLIVTDKSTQEKHLYQPLQTNKKQFEIAVTFLTGYKGIFDITNSNNRFYFMRSITDEDGSVQITTPPGAYEIEAPDKEIKGIIIGEDHFREANYPFKIKPDFSTLGSFIEISPQGPIVGCVFDDST